jgi:hypothetical protein
MYDDAKLFQILELREALAYSHAGALAVHLHRIVFSHSPKCFIRDVRAGRPIAHVFCLDAARLRVIARQLGVRVIFIDKEGTPDQHLDLCGKPLAQLLLMLGRNVQEFTEKGT